MDLDHCAHCGAEIEDEWIEYRSRRFCSDDCCDQFDEVLLANGEPLPDELEDSELAEMELADVDFDENGGFEDDLDEALPDDEF